MEVNNKDKFKALWLSHSSIGDYLKCPRLYFLRNVYKDPISGHKFTVMTPPLALGQAVHEVVESLSVLPTEERLKNSLVPPPTRPMLVAIPNGLPVASRPIPTAIFPPATKS